MITPQQLGFPVTALGPNDPDDGEDGDPPTELFPLTSGLPWRGFQTVGATIISVGTKQADRSGASDKQDTL